MPQTLFFEEKCPNCGDGPVNDVREMCPECKADFADMCDGFDEYKQVL